MRDRQGETDIQWETESEIQTVRNRQWETDRGRQTERQTVGDRQ